MSTHTHNCNTQHPQGGEIVKIFRWYIGCRDKTSPFFGLAPDTLNVRNNPDILLLTQASIAIRFDGTLFSYIFLRNCYNSSTTFFKLCTGMAINVIVKP